LLHSAVSYSALCHVKTLSTPRLRWLRMHQSGGRPRGGSMRLGTLAPLLDGRPTLLEVLLHLLNRVRRHPSRSCIVCFAEARPEKPRVGEGEGTAAQDGGVSRMHCNNCRPPGCTWGCPWCSSSSHILCLGGRGAHWRRVCGGCRRGSSAAATRRRLPPLLQQGLRPARGGALGGGRTPPVPPRRRPTPRGRTVPAAESGSSAAGPAAQMNRL